MASFVRKAILWKLFFLELALRIIQIARTWKRWVELRPHRSGLVRYQWQDGLPFCPNHGGGVGLPQVYCFPIDLSLSDAEVIFSDDVIFRQSKEGMFQFIVLLKSLPELNEASLALPNVDKICGKYVLAKEATFIVQSTEAQNTIVLVPTFSGLQLLQNLFPVLSARAEQNQSCMTCISLRRSCEASALLSLGPIVMCMWLATPGINWNRSVPESSRIWA
jgi:hypothetical protein